MMNQYQQSTDFTETPMLAAEADGCEPPFSTDDPFRCSRWSRCRRRFPSSSLLVMTTCVVVVATLATKTAGFVPHPHRRLHPRFVLQAATSTREATSLSAASRPRKSKKKSAARQQREAEEKYMEKEGTGKSRGGSDIETFTLDMFGDVPTPEVQNRPRSKYRPESSRSVRGAMTRKNRAKYEAELGRAKLPETIARNSGRNSNNGDLSSLPEPVVNEDLGMVSDNPQSFKETEIYGKKQARAKQRKKSKEQLKKKVIDERKIKKAFSSDRNLAAKMEADFMISGATAVEEESPQRKSDNAGSLKAMDDESWARFQQMTDQSRSKVVTRGPAKFDLYEYYNSELLTAQEEYELGMKVRFMVKCEEVHEGLCIAHDRLPTLEEWAVACGFNDTDANFVARNDDQHLRPSGWEDRFKVVDPTWFVGRRTAGELGVGRGKGGKKKALPTSLPDYIDDSANRFRQRGSPKIALGPVNRGTTRTFLTLLGKSRAAKEELIRCNMRLVLSIAQKFNRGGVSVPDLVQEGSIGLAKAAMKYKPRMGFRFSTYASWWIQQAVYNAIARDSRTIRLPAHIHNLLNRIRKVKRTLETSLGRLPTNSEIAAELKMTEEKYVEMMKRTRRCISLDGPKWRANGNNDESTETIGDTIASEERPDADAAKAIDRDIFMEDLKDMMQDLSSNERAVISARYGLVTGTARSVKAVAALMNQTNGWVRLNELRGLRKLRRPWYEKRLKEHQAAIMKID